MQYRAIPITAYLPKTILLYSGWKSSPNNHVILRIFTLALCIFVFIGLEYHCVIIVIGYITADKILINV